MKPLADAPFIDFLDPDVIENPDEHYAELRRQTAVARTPLGATVLHRDAVRALLGDARLVSSIPLLVQMQGVGNGPLHEMVSSSVISMDGEDHTRVRRLVSRAFTPSAAARHRPTMQALVHELVDTFADRGECEFVSEFADHYPVQVICEVLGVPRADHPKFARWGDTLTYVLSLELGAHLDEVQEASNSMREYVGDLIAQRQAEPQDDLVTALVQASEDGDRLNDAELFSMIGGLLFAGYDTTRNQLGLAMHTFAGHLDQWKLLAEQPELAPRAVDEVMRLYGAVGGVPRVTREDIEVGGWLIPAWTILFLSVASANRDEAAYEDPLEFDIAALRESHLTFGSGPHYCLGANLARAEMEEALAILPQRMRNLRVIDEPVWRTGTGIYGPTQLKFGFDTT